MIHRLLFVSVLAVCFIPQTRGVEPHLPTPSRDYQNFCASCHGNNGDGQGKAARFLFPKPRSLTSHPFQYATSMNRVASSQDIELVIREGIPNTSMNGWTALTDLQIQSLVRDVLAFRLYGANKRYVDLLVNNGELLNTADSVFSPQQIAEAEKYVKKETIPASNWKFEIAAQTPNSLANGQRLYMTQNCHKCHGLDGRGSYGIDLIGEYGFPTFARDLVSEPFKYGTAATDVARGIKLGINGTKMPASTTLNDEELGDLTLYVLSLHKPQKTTLTNAQRYQRSIGNLDKTR